MGENTNTLKEEWRQICIKNRKLLVSNHGNIRFCKQSIVYSNGRVANYQERDIKHVINNEGRPVISVCQRQKLIAHLVAEAFIGERPDNMFVGHKDSDRTNNKITNLEYISQSRNTLNIADGVRCDSKSRIRGVSLNISRGFSQWRGEISIDKKEYRYFSQSKMKVVAWRKIMEIIHKADRRLA